MAGSNFYSSEITFTPMSLEDYLRVPKAINEEKEKQEEKIETYKDKLSYYKAILGDAGADVFSEYDKEIDDIASNISNYTIGDLKAKSK